MNRRAFLAAVAAGALFPSRAVAADGVAQRCDDYVGALARLGRFNGVALVQFGERIAFEQAYGDADIAHHVRCITATQFDAASISKMFTAYATLLLRDRGALKLDDSIAGYLDDCPAQWRPVTVAQLIHHTSGIPDYEESLDLESPAYLQFMREPNSSQRIIARQKALPLDFAPGTRWRYSNTGYIVLSMIVERAAGMPFGAVLHRDVFDPAGMRETGVFGYDRPVRLAVGSKAEPIPWPEYLAGFRIAQYAQPLPQLPLSPPHGDAGVFTTAGDLARWNARMLGGGFVSPARRAEIFDGDDAHAVVGIDFRDRQEAGQLARMTCSRTGRARARTMSPRRCPRSPSACRTIRRSPELP
jgi:CubicO group peptidase (beta-lactamase class C family)